MNHSADLFTASIEEGDPDKPNLGPPELFLGSPANESMPAFSPDGRWIAYASDDSGAVEIFVVPLPTRPADGRSRTAAAVLRSGLGAANCYIAVRTSASSRSRTPYGEMHSLPAKHAGGRKSCYPLSGRSRHGTWLRTQSG